MKRFKLLIILQVCSAIVFGIYGYFQAEPEVARLNLAVASTPNSSSTSPATQSGKETSKEKTTTEKTKVEPASGEQSPATSSTKLLAAEKATGTNVTGTNAEQPVKIAFELPFPERINLFQPPRRQGKTVMKSAGQTELSVELLGFVNVDGPRVALAIDGMAMTIAEGETRAGVEVLSIQPPSVVLRRGRQRWQASFEN